MIGSELRFYFLVTVCVCSHIHSSSVSLVLIRYIPVFVFKCFLLCTIFVRILILLCVEFDFVSFFMLVINILLYWAGRWDFLCTVTKYCVRFVASQGQPTHFYIILWVYVRVCLDIFSVILFTD